MPRFTLDLGDQFDQLLADLAKAKETTKADVIRRAVASYVYLNEHTDRDKGTKVSITDTDDRVLKDVVLP